MTLETYTEQRNEIEVRLDLADVAVQSYAKKEMGLVELTDEFREDRRAFNRVFQELRTLNGSVSNKIKREYSMKRRFAK